MKKIVAVLGDASAAPGSDRYELAFQTGRMLVDEGYRVQCGGMAGVMEAVCAGARSSARYQDGDTIAITPSFDRSKVNEYADIVIPTGMDVVRNAITGNADAVIAIGGGAGTLSELAMAWTYYRLIIAYRTIPGWAQKLADTRIDSRIRYDDIPDDKVFGADSPAEAAQILKERIALYTKGFEGISWRDPRKDK